MKTDKSSKVGGRRNKGSMATRRSVAKKPKGNLVTMKGGSRAYHNNGAKA